MKVGRFEVEVSQPYPCWISLACEQGETMRFSHRELRDLEYAVAWAIRQAKLNLGRDGRSICDESEV